MSSFDFIVENIRFSYSSTSTYETCPHSFKLGYIYGKPKINNFYGEYGTFVHKCFEKFFTEDVEPYELSPFYKEHYDEEVKLPAPVPPVGLDVRYKKEGQAYFDNFNFNKSRYDILLVEDKIDFELGDTKFVAKPDLVIRNKETGKATLVDYKTSAPWRIDKRTGKEVQDTAKLKGYFKQMYLYTYALRFHRNIPIENIVLWFPRLRRELVHPWDMGEEIEAITWITGVVDEIQAEEDFPPKKSSYFCENLCGVREFCEYR